MKKILITTCVILMVSTVANACGGITVKGNSGTSYCLSKHTMNWYSAYAWCEAQGMELIDLGGVCKSSTSCPELNLSSDQQQHITDNGGTVGYVWSNDSSSSSIAIAINLSGGKVYIGFGTFARNTKISVLCF